MLNLVVSICRYKVKNWLKNDDAVLDLQKKILNTLEEP